jgi:hypothetical protein
MPDVDAEALLAGAVAKGLLVRSGERGGSRYELSVGTVIGRFLRFPAALATSARRGMAEAESRSLSGVPLYQAEGEGFEPSIRLTTDNGFRDRRIRPLCHPSEAEKEGFEPSMETFIPITP